jgi:hypothetical protein
MIGVALLFRRHSAPMPDWLQLVFFAFGVVALVSAVVGGWHSLRPKDHGAEALKRIRERRAGKR